MSAIQGVVTTPVERRADDRGFFTEILRASQWPDTFVQANHSHSRRGALRGLHYHRQQADLWYVLRGRAQVGLADLRGSGTPTIDTIVLDADEPATLFIPPGVAHGYLALTDLDLFYWVTKEYDSTDEFGVAWDDPVLSIPWELNDPILSERDASAPGLNAD
ncbi:MAG TPA: dTDP-4-dehydrorhamnose 3,5-epimerase family protein [Fimbriimonadaceae bacterium]|nr:dTDP-4-dehydrorhamnose 3,5-epimerase family protein [Fimbriimonadaceae bacterium]